MGDPEKDNDGTHAGSSLLRLSPQTSFGGICR